MNIRYFLRISLILIIVSCQSNEDNLQIRDYYAEGTADSSLLEKGYWKYFDIKSHSLCQEGAFVDGVRQGAWKYFNPEKYSIVWMQFRSKDSMIRTNIPINFLVEIDDSGFVAFNHIDTSVLLRLKIATSEFSRFEIEQYRINMLNEVKYNSLDVSTPKYLVINTTCNNRYYLSRFDGVDKDKRHYTLLTINRITTENRLMEITIRFDKERFVLGEEIFYSVFSNLYIGEDRFFDGNIACEILKDNKVRTKHKLSFGCNRR